ncbi:hypothetical protein GC163_15905 [bacterium]|nr:hypothetical protein [bacterium]
MSDDVDIPESRDYRHLACRSVTTISGQPFEVMSNPLSDMARTWCSQCESFFPLSEYEWVDTNEAVLAYYARHGAKATPLHRFLCSRKNMIIMASIGFVAGGVGGYFLFRGNELRLKLLMVPFCGGLGTFGGLAVYISVLCEPITRSVCGVKDTRVLR